LHDNGSCQESEIWNREIATLGKRHLTFWMGAWTGAKADGTTDEVRRGYGEGGPWPLTYFGEW
jgi:hypothetical protein